MILSLSEEYGGEVRVEGRELSGGDELGCSQIAETLACLQEP